jgi:anaerobic selenocysteine-containing dehydrogenase
MTQPSLIPAICPYCAVGCGLYIADTMLPNLRGYLGR